MRGLLHRMLADAWRAEIIENNPVARVKLPPSREIRKERTILTDDELAQFVACEAVDLELRMMALVARCEGGMRTGDLHKWDWSMIDRVAFATSPALIARRFPRHSWTHPVPDVTMRV